ncbi:MAG: hypothetical protein KAK00_05270 [Nanoarchaeota archaeon]|nr:hypothetical protein [Nanoarchaeota archaeon]
MSTKEKLNWILLPYKGKGVLEVEERVQQFTERDLSNLVEEHARKIARHLGKDENKLVQAIVEENKKTINDYIPGLSPQFAQEEIYNLEGFDPTTERLTLGITTGLMAKALQNVYKDQDPTQNPIVLQGILITKDEKIVLGIRSKPNFRANQPDEPFDYKIMPIPAGYALLHEEKNLTQLFYLELNEESGLHEENIASLSIIYNHDDIGFTGGKRITLLAYTNNSFREVEESWRNAPHSWEYEGLLEIECSSKAMRELLTTRNFSKYHEKAKGLLEPTIVPVFEYIASNPTIIRR